MLTDGFPPVYASSSQKTGNQMVSIIKVSELILVLQVQHNPPLNTSVCLLVFFGAGLFSH